MLTTRQEKTSTARPASLWQQLSGALGGGERRGLFAKRGADPARVKPGRIFRCSDNKGRCETATVIDLCEILGMPHVRYDLRIDQPGHRPFEDGPRVLGMKTFVEHFSEAVGS